MIGLTRKRNSEEASIRVGVTLGRGTDLGEALSSLSQEGEARSPLDSGLTTEEGSKNRSLRFVARSAESGGSRECNNNSVTGFGRDTLLAAMVLGSCAGMELVLTRAARAGEFLEELANPLGQVSRVRATTNKGNVGLGISLLGELGEGFSRKVFLERSSGRRGNALTQAAVEGQSMGSIDSLLLRVGGKGLLSEFEVLDDDLI